MIIPFAVNIPDDLPENDCFLLTRIIKKTVEDTTKKYRPATRATIYVQNDLIAVINGPGMKLVGSIKSGEVGVKGIMLKADAAGQLAVAGATDTAVAIAEETVTGASTTGSDIMVRSLI